MYMLRVVRGDFGWGFGFVATQVLTSFSQKNMKACDYFVLSLLLCPSPDSHLASILFFVYHLRDAHVFLINCTALCPYFLSLGCEPLPST